MTLLAGKSDNDRSHAILRDADVSPARSEIVHPSYVRHNPVSFARRNKTTSHHSCENIAASIEGAA